MSRLVFDFNNALAQNVGQHGFTPEQIKAAQGELSAAHTRLKAKPLGFRKLPATADAILSDIEKTAADIRSRCDTFVVLGIGGSALGPIAVHQALDTGKSPVRLVVEDNVDPERFARVLNGLDLKKTAFNAVTKSGKTSETMAQMMAVAARLKSAGLPNCRSG